MTDKAKLQEYVCLSDSRCGFSTIMRSCKIWAFHDITHPSIQHDKWFYWFSLCSFIQILSETKSLTLWLPEVIIRAIICSCSVWYEALVFIFVRSCMQCANTHIPVMFRLSLMLVIYWNILFIYAGKNVFVPCSEI